MKLFQRPLNFLASLFGVRKKPIEDSPVPKPQPPIPAVPPAVRRSARVEERRGDLIRECHNHGYEAARKGGRRTSDPAALKSLEGWAESQALGMSQSSSQGAQANNLRRLQEWEAIKDERVLHRDSAANKLSLSRHALAATPEPGACPDLNPVLRYTATGWLTSSLTPTCHDLLVGLDPFMKWVAGGVVAGCISVAIIRGILPPSDSKVGAPSANAPARHHGGLIAGLLLGLAFFVLRLSGARTYGDMFLASALAVMETGAVVLVERRARPLFAEIGGWRERLSVRRIAACVAGEDQLDLDRRQSLVDEASREIGNIEDSLECAHAGNDPKLLASIGIKALNAGYMKGISENAADLGGVA